jgi:hypothetical protein
MNKTPRKLSLLNKNISRTFLHQVIKELNMDKIMELEEVGM